MIALGDLPGGSFDSFARAVSSDGSIVLGTSDTALGSQVFIWDQANGMRNLQDVLGGAVPAGWTLTAARGIASDNTTLVGYGINPSGTEEAFLAFIPEPSTALLLGLGLGGLSMRRRAR